jgi:cyanophycin synthase-like protein
MKQIISIQPVSQSIHSEHFSLMLSPTEYDLKMTMQMRTPVFHTCDLPATCMILQKLLPSIFTSKCFNDNKYTFTKEVRNTEVGHLFEHILLEYLCIERMNMGYKEAVFNGVTNWNWAEDPKGTFHIEIDAGWDKKEMILAAVEKSKQLLHVILETKNMNSSSYN